MSYITNYKGGRVGIPLAGIIPPYFCTCFIPGSMSNAICHVLSLCFVYYC